MIIIVDTGPLTHFAQAGLLDTLKTLLSPFAACVYPREVYDELVSGSAVLRATTTFSGVTS